MTKTLYFSNACKKLAQKKQTLQPFLWTLFSLILLVGSASTVLYYIFTHVNKYIICKTHSPIPPLFCFYLSDI